MSKHSQLNIEQPLELAVLGAEHFPELIHALEENAIKITTDKNNSANPEEPPYSLEIPANARNQYAAGHSIDINLIYDGSKIAIRAHSTEFAK